MIAMTVSVSRAKVTGIVAALACLAFSAIGLKVNDPPDFTYVDGVRDQTVEIEGAELTVGEVQVGTRIVRRGEVRGRDDRHVRHRSPPPWPCPDRSG